MISSLGSSSIDSLLLSYRALEERPIRALETQRNSIDKRISLFTSLKSKLSSLESLAKDLSYTDATSVFGSRSVSLSDDSYFTATVSTSAILTPHTVSVSQLAKSDKIVSNQYTLSGTTLFSTLGAGTQSFDVTVNGTTKTVSVDIAANDDNETILNSIVTAVNSTADIGIKASILEDTDTTGRLVFTSEETGADYEMTLADNSGTLLATTGMNDSVAMSGTSGGYIYQSSELNAIAVIDGVTITRNSNTIEDAIQGVTLNLKKVHGTGEAAVTVNVESDTENIKSKLQEFIDAYNDIIGFIETNTTVDTTNYTRSALSGDFTVTNLRLQLRSLITEPVTGITSGDATILAQLGITTDRHGKLSISDADTLDDYLESNLDQVSALFNSTNGISNKLTALLDDYTNGDGIIQKRKDVLQSQINQINDRIDRMEATVDRKMEYYREQFGQMQAAMAMYNAQYSSLGNLAQSSFISY